MAEIKGTKPIPESDELLEILKKWKLPQYEKIANKHDDRVSNVLGKTIESFYVEEEEEEELKPPTAEEIEEIRQAAYEEGFAEGKEKGFEEGYQEGREKGYEDGMTQGLAEGKQTAWDEAQPEIEERKSLFTHLAEDLQHPLRELDDAVEQELVYLATSLAEAVVDIEIEVNAEIVKKAIEQAVTALPIADAQCEIKLNPEDFAFVTEAYTEEELEDRGWHLVPDEHVKRGGCIVESHRSVIDRTICERVRLSIYEFLKSSGIEKEEEK